MSQMSTQISTNNYGVFREKISVISVIKKTKYKCHK